MKNNLVTILFLVSCLFISAQNYRYTGFNDIEKALLMGKGGVYVSSSDLPKDVYLLHVTTTDADMPFVGSKNMLIAVRIDKDSITVSSRGMLVGEENSGFRFVSKLDGLISGFRLQYVDVRMIGDTLICSIDASGNTGHGSVLSSYYKYKKGRLYFIGSVSVDPAEIEYNKGLSALEKGNVHEEVNIFKGIQFPERFVGKQEETAYLILQKSYLISAKALLDNNYAIITALADDFTGYPGTSDLIDDYIAGKPGNAFALYDKFDHEIPLISSDSFAGQITLFSKGYLVSRRADDAVKLLLDIIRIKPDSADAYLELSEADKLLNDTAGSVAAYKRYMELSKIR